MTALLTPRQEYYATELFESLDSLLSDDESLVEILCCLSNKDIKAIKVIFEKSKTSVKYIYLLKCVYLSKVLSELPAHNKLLESAISAKSFGNFERLLVALCSANRDESPTVNDLGEAIGHALQDAKNLQKAGVDRIGTDEAVFIQVLTQRSWPHVQEICNQYLNLTGHTLRKAIGREFSGAIKVNC